MCTILLLTHIVKRKFHTGDHLYFSTCILCCSIIGFEMLAQLGYKFKMKVKKRKKKKRNENKFNIQSYLSFFSVCLHTTYLSVYFLYTIIFIIFICLSMYYLPVLFIFCWTTACLRVCLFIAFFSAVLMH